MSSDLSYECTFNSVIVLDNWISPNRYKCKVYFDVETEDGDHQNIAFERMKILLESVFEGAMFISINNPMLQTLAKKAKNRIICLPTEPIDVIMAAVIYSKLNAIVEDKLSVVKVKVSSSQADNIWVNYDEDFTLAFQLESEFYKVTEQKPWWERSDPATGDWFEVGKKDIKFHFQKASWEKDLQWNTAKTEDKTSPKWKPEVIKGGKETKH
jgi:hypothetical protein